MQLPGKARCCALLLALWGGTPWAAVTDLASAPLADGSNSSTLAKPNIALMMDDSVSMAWQNMPDDPTVNFGKPCWGWHGYNTLFYNPAYTYRPPFKIDGEVYADGVRRYPDARFEAALYDGYFPANAASFGGSKAPNESIDLNTLGSLKLDREDCHDCLRPATKYYYATPLSNPASASCGIDSNYRTVSAADAIGAPDIPASGRTPDQIKAAKTNYANWFSYYRTRAGLMKAAAGEAFKDVDQEKYRIGLFFLNSVDSGVEGAASMPNRDLRIADFSGSGFTNQRYLWFNRLYGARAGGNTPLRGALSRLGHMYAGTAQRWDPVQYSCQQNFAILLTDGYWNDGSENANYGPKGMDDANVGDTDGAPVAAVGASAALTLDNFNKAPCYYASSIRVKSGKDTVELLDAQRVPRTCPGNKDGLGQALRDSVNAKSAQTGFSATYYDGKLTLRAPAGLGNFRETPTITLQRAGNGRGTTISVAAFGGGVDERAGAEAPFMDKLRVPDTLADVAYYYYTTDLRTTRCTNTIDGIAYGKLCDDNVRGSGRDTNEHQHMATFTIGLGVNGNIFYEDDYENGRHIDGLTQYADILSRSANWPDPGSSERAKIDDLWHAAVNGRGRYYHATDALSLKRGLQGAMAGILEREGSGAAAATSSQEPVAGDNMLYAASYKSVEWSGDLQSYTIDPTSARISREAAWSAQARLDARLKATGSGADDRKIWFFKPDAPARLMQFTFSNLSVAGLGGHFNQLCGKLPTVDQCGIDGDDLDAAQRALANDGSNLVAWLRGQSQHEDKVGNPAAAKRLFRSRDHALGDIVNAAPVYAKAPPFGYGKFDPTYSKFVADNKNRAATLYAGANDGMLHAFDAASGDERWAYVPAAVMPRLWRLADRGYGKLHRYQVDGSPVLGDICVSLDAGTPQLCQENGWKTILVGGLNGGGCAYYAMDVTDPAKPQGLWEFSNDNLGYSYGNPLIVKRSNGQWVVILASGYNNYPDNGCGGRGDGNGRIFVLDAGSGKLLAEIPTMDAPSVPAGTVASPNGLAKLNPWIEDAANPVADRIYGGDMLGNVWRFDVDKRHAPFESAVRLAQLKDANGKAQPVTVKPELAITRSKGIAYPLVLAATGRYLGVNDLKDTQQQTLYALKDTLTANGIGDTRGSAMLARTLKQATGSSGGLLAGRTIRTVAGERIDWAQKDGWYLDFNPGGTSPGERVNTPMSLSGHMLSLVTNVPTDNACDAGGRAYLYFMDVNTGLQMTSAAEGMAGLQLVGNTLVAGFSTISMGQGKTVTLYTRTNAVPGTEVNPVRGSASGRDARRTAWREIMD
jgi:type IV pilus assembly protein PilY1